MIGHEPDPGQGEGGADGGRHGSATPQRHGLTGRRHAALRWRTIRAEDVIDRDVRVQLEAHELLQLSGDPARLLAVIDAVGQSDFLAALVCKRRAYEALLGFVPCWLLVAARIFSISENGNSRVELTPSSARLTRSFPPPTSMREEPRADWTTP